MSVYAPLRKFLAAERQPEVHLGFRDVERLLGRELPKTAKINPAWWSNNPNRHTQALAWLEAGFLVESLDLAEQRVSFVRKSRPL